jgi:hypothetical protein
MFHLLQTITLSNKKEAYLIGDGLCLINEVNRVEVRPINPDTMGVDTLIDRYYRFAKSLGDRFNWSVKGNLWKIIGYHGQCNDELSDKAINRMGKLNLGLCVTAWEVG